LAVTEDLPATVAPATVAPTSTTTVPTTTPPSTTAPVRVVWPADGLNWGDRGEAVVQLQTDLESLGFRTGDAIDGSYGSGTASAVMAFEKFEGIARDGIADAEMLQRLAEPTGGMPMEVGRGTPRIEIDIARQLLFARTDTGAVTVLNTSTGSGELYEASNGKYYNANTPTGEFSIERRIDGYREAFLGSLYRPLYFKRGWAIHGSNSVPGYPASHGCARLRNNDQDWMFETFSDGTEVSVYEFAPVLDVAVVANG